jgi:hypothetical protein
VHGLLSMKLGAVLSIILICLFSANSAKAIFLGGGPATYSGVSAVTIDHTKVGTVNNTDQSNFPVLISGTYATLKTVANGGQIINTVSSNGQTVPADLVFSSDAKGTTLLSWEIASYNATTGAIEVWVKVPTVSHTTDTVIYLLYGNAGITTYQGTATSTWDSNFRGVYHAPNGTTLSTNDSTSNAFNLTNTGTATATTGKIDGGGNLNGTSQYFSSSASFLASNSTNYTWEGWVYSTTTAVSQHFFTLGASTSQYSIELFTSGANWEMYQLNGTDVNAAQNGTFTANVWHHVAGSWDGSNIRLYVDGALAATTACNGRTATGTITKFGAAGNGTSNFWNGILDEMRLSNVARSTDWIKTEYNNQNSPSTFYTLSPTL